MKTCPKCKIEKDESEFSKDKYREDGLVSQCKACRAEHYKTNRERELKRQAEYNATHKQERAEYQAEYMAKYRVTRKQGIAEYKAEYYATHKAEIAEYQAIHKAEINEYKRNRRRTDPLFALQHRLRNITKRAFRAVNAPKTSKTFQLLGCTGKELLDLWDVEVIPEGYHIDHICPLAQACTVEEAEKLCHYSNLRLLPGFENMAKSDSKTPEGVEKCLAILGREWIDKDNGQEPTHATKA